jgi:phosphoglycolate phosphatase
VLADFEAADLPWGIVTNKPGWLTGPLLEQLGLSGRACCVVSGDTVNERKPHPLPLLHAAAVTGVSPDHCVYVGDAERDIVAGRAAGMQTVIAACGYLAEHDHPETWNADGIIERPEDVMDWLTLRHRDALVAS